ncbi:MAG: hemerythrin domain-containing protein [Myxococcales bacterium]|nr:hemerythrin domain-containing protein [Myxococcales bacterium]
MVDMARVENSHRNVTEYLSLDHDRLDLLLLEVIKLVAARRFNEARPRLSNFAFGLRRHIHLEDEFVFPRFEQLTGMTGGPTMVMRDEHRAIEHHLAGMIDAAMRDDRDGFDSEQEAMVAVLSDHTAREEAVIYPMLDRHLPAADRETFVAELQAYR